MKTLQEILDENPNWAGFHPAVGTDKGLTHSYIDGFYEPYLARYREKKIKLLEVGVMTGKNMLLWDRYFVKHKGIWGVDVTDVYVDKELRGKERLHVEVGDAYTEEMAGRLPDFDIIIDDGPHTLESQVKFINIYMKKLKPGGIMVVEDVQDPQWFEALQGAVTDEQKIFWKRIDLRSVKGRYDDLMFCIIRLD